MEFKTDITPEKKYKNFNETFKLCAFSMAFACLYPNRTNQVRRYIFTTMVVIFSSVQIFWFTAYTFKCLLSLDIYNFSRNMTLAVIVVLFFIKTYYAIYATDRFAPLLDLISADLLKANDMEEEYQKVYDSHIREGKVGEIAWLLIPTIMSIQFPVYAGVLMSIESIQTDDYKRRMVHDMDLLYVEDIQNEGPFFHCMFAYNFVHCIVLVPNFTGMDGSFCIVTSHLRLKLKLLTLKVEQAFKNSHNVYELRFKLRGAIKDHQEALEFYEKTQFMYGTWLLTVFMLTSFLISFSLYQIHLLQRIDPKYTSFMMVGVFHIYLPCHYASLLTKVGEDVPDELYSVCWEEWADPVCTNLLIFMICRSQKHLILTGNGLVVYNMELFKSIMQTSYSFFTLITA